VRALNAITALIRKPLPSATHGLLAGGSFLVAQLVVRRSPFQFLVRRSWVPVRNSSLVARRSSSSFVAREFQFVTRRSSFVAR